jgi:multidrug resistance efflux pump
MRRAKRWLLRLPSLIVWGAALIGATMLYLRQEHAVTLTGVASELRFEVAPSASGRVGRLEVAVGDEVVKGQIVASLDDRDLLLDLREARAEILRLSALVGREAEAVKKEHRELETDRLRERRRFARDVETAVLDHIEALAAQAEDRVRLRGLELAYERTKSLLDSGTTTQALLDADKTAHDALEKAIAERETRIGKLAERRRQAERRYEEFARAAPPSAAESEAMIRPHRHAVEVQEVRVERANLQIAKLVLRAPGAGVVAAILRRPGEHAAAGEPVVSIVAPRATEIVAWIPEQRIAEVRPGTRVRLRRAATPGVTAESTVVALGPRVELLPERTDPAAVMKRWGLPVQIPLPPSLVARPGEAFEIELIRAEARQ